MLLDLERSPRLSPARVVRVENGRVQLEFPDELAWAAVALAFPYAPAADDEVLAIGQDDTWYVIGVLRGSGTTNLTVPGNLTIRAPSGAIELAAARGVRI